MTKWRLVHTETSLLDDFTHSILYDYGLHMDFIHIMELRFLQSPSASISDRQKTSKPQLGSFVKFSFDKTILDVIAFAYTAFFIALKYKLVDSSFGEFSYTALQSYFHRLTVC